MVANALSRDFAHDTASSPDHARSAQAFVATRQGTVRLTRHSDFASVESLWRTFETNAIRSHAQGYVWMETWHRFVEAPLGNEAAIVVGTDERGSVLFVWPFTVEKRARLRTLSWISQDHANYNMGLHARDFAARLAPEDVAALLAAAAKLAGASLAILRQQPRVWDGLANPFALLPHQASPSSGHAVTLQIDFESLFSNRFGKATRNTLKRKERKLSTSGSVDYGWARSLGERLDMLEVFLRQKSRWFAAEGIPDAFADSRHRAFYRAMTALDSADEGQLQVGFMKVGDEVAATLIGCLHAGRFTVLLSSITEAELRRWSPGLLLMREQIADLCRRGLDCYDLGVGENRNKSEWTDSDIPLFDSSIGFDAGGRLLAMPWSLATRLKRAIKGQPRLWALAQFVRRSLRGRAAGAETEGD